MFIIDSWFTLIPLTNPLSVVLACSSALLIFGLRRIHTAIPGPLIVTVLATVLSLRWDLHACGLKLVMDLRPVSYTHLRAHETVLDLVCRLLLEQKKLLYKN